MVKHGWAPPSAAIRNGDMRRNPMAILGTDVDRGRSAHDFAGGWKGLASAADAVRQRDLAAGTSAAANAVSRRDFAEGASWAADTARELYDREYARDLLNRWSWWSGGGWGYGSSGGGYSSPYSTSDGGYTNGYSSDAGQGYDSSAYASSPERNDSAQSSEANQENAADTDEETAAAKQSMKKAVQAFRIGEYARAQAECEQANRLVPDNANVQEYCALCQFAQGKYQDAADTLNVVLASGPGWNWDILSSFYTNSQTYIKQLRALEHFVNEHPKDAAGRFVLAYHYLVLDEHAAAVGELQEVVKLQPKDRVSAGILKTLEEAKQGRVDTPPVKPAPGY